MCAAAFKITSLTELRNSDHVRFVQGDFLHVGATHVNSLCVSVCDITFA